MDIKELENLNMDIYNINVNIGNKVKNFIDIPIINKNIEQSLFEKYENYIKKICPLLKNSKYISYHNDNLTLILENNINFVIEKNIKYIKHFNNNNIFASLNVYNYNLLDNINFPNKDTYQNIIKHNDNIYKFIIKYIKIPLYIHFDKTDKYNNIYIETELNYQQLNNGINGINYILNCFNSQSKLNLQTK